MKRRWIDINITVLGLSKSGISGAKYLNKQGANCTISEKREASSEDKIQIAELEKSGIKVETGGNKEETILNSDLIITSPGIPPHADVYKIIKSRKIETFGEIDLAYRETNVPFIAITGTNGKTTVTELVSQILTAGGLKAPVCGNIGIPATSLLDEKNVDYFVAELSSYQIATNPAFKPQIGVFLNYTPEHTEWHGNEEKYFKAKSDLFLNREPTWAVLNALNFKIAYLKLDITSNVYFFGRESEDKCVFIKDNKILIKDKNKKVTEVMNISEIPLKGKHNIENVTAATAIAHIIGIDAETIRTSIKNFSTPEHRLKYTDTVNGTEYYNDSKATNPEAAIHALKAFDDKKIVLIAGGKDKGTDLTEFCNSVKKHANTVILIGEASERFERELINSGFNAVYKKSDLAEAVDVASELNPEIVLFSPACASFDMFKNFEERGDAFKNYVRSKKTQH